MLLNLEIFNKNELFLVLTRLKFLLSVLKTEDETEEAFIFHCLFLRFENVSVLQPS